MAKIDVQPVNTHLCISVCSDDVLTFPVSLVVNMHSSISNYDYKTKECSKKKKVDAWQKACCSSIVASAVQSCCSNNKKPLSQVTGVVNNPVCDPRGIPLRMLLSVNKVRGEPRRIAVRAAGRATSGICGWMLKLVSPADRFVGLWYKCQRFKGLYCVTKRQKESSTDEQSSERKPLWNDAERLINALVTNNRVRNLNHLCNNEETLVVFSSNLWGFVATLCLISL